MACDKSVQAGVHTGGCEEHAPKIRPASKLQSYETYMELGFIH